jgi:hypothetical protein
MRATFIISLVGTFLSTFSKGEISLLAETTPPDPNEEITVWVHTDEPLLFLVLDAYVTGDATITSAMSETDCNEFGWENGWGFEPIIDNSNGWVSIGGICWAADANEIVGYFKFRYHSGYVAIYIDQENSIAGNWGNNFTFSDEALSFGEMVLPPLKEPNVPTPVLIQCPLGSGGPPRGEPNSFPEWSQQFEMLGMLDSEPTVIEIDSDITTNQVWDANNVYYVTEPNGINVQALLVIEPGTTVIFGYQCGLFVNNGGTLIAKGTPDKPIVFTPDWVYYDYPDCIGYYWQVLAWEGPYYYSPIFIQETASPATTIMYNMIEGAVGGIVTENIRLDNPIENNYLFGNVWGIYEFGSLLTDISNNLCFYQDQAAIEVELCPDPNGVPDTENIFKIEHNTCDGSQYTYCGITIHGAPDLNALPTVHVINNVVTQNYSYGLNFVYGGFYGLVANAGYYNNYYDKNCEFDEYNPVYAETNPYSPYIGEKAYQHHYLADDSAFIDAGTQYIEQTKLIGMTTNFDSLPDKDKVDLGFHHMDWNYVGGEGVAGTDMDDLIEISNYWLTWTPYDPNSPNYQDPNIVDPNTISYGGDWNDNGFVDMADFALLTELWQAKPDEPNIIPIISDGISEGWMRVGVDQFTSNIQAIFVYVDGHYIGRIAGFDKGRLLDIDGSEFGPGSHQLKLIALDWDGYILCSHLTDFTISSGLNYCILPQIYDPNKPLPFATHSTGTEPNHITVEVYSDGGQLVWTQTFSGNSVNASIPATITGNHEIDCVYFDVGSGGYINKSTRRRISPLSPVDPDVKAILVLPSMGINLMDFRTIRAVEDAFKDKGIKYLKFTGPDACYANIFKYAPQIKYMYINAHGQCSVGDEDTSTTFRTYIVLADGDTVSMKVSDFPEGQAPSWLEPLPGNREQTLKSFVSMGFQKLEFVHFDGCLGGYLTIHPLGILMKGHSGEQGLSSDVTHNDMSLAFCAGRPNDTFLYQGWYNESESFIPVPWPKIDWWIIQLGETSYQKFSRIEWEELGDGKTLYWALWETTQKQTEFGPDDAVQNYRIKGQGSIFDVRLRSN